MTNVRDAGAGGTNEKRAEIRRSLLENNPFASSAAPSPWDNASPDLDSLNRDVFEQIAQIVRDKRREPAAPMAGLVLGEAGSGKTHMLKRLLEKIRKNDQAALFVSVRAFLDPDSVMRDLLREVFINLNQMRRDGRTQLGFLAERLLECYRELCAERRRAPREGDGRHKDLKRAMQGIDDAFLRCVLRYAETDDEDLRSEISYWLMGESDEAHPELLGVADREAMSSSALENEARELLLSLGRLLRYCDVPMIVCFDQLDGMDKKELINAWGGVVHSLVNDVNGVLPLAFLRADTWNHRFSPILDDSVIQRFPNRLYMQNCTLEEARRLIRDRVEAFFGEGMEEKYSWLMDRLKDVLRTDLSPRMVIDLANRAILQADVASVPGRPRESSAETEEQEIVERLEQAYLEEREKVAAERDMWRPNREHLTLALETWLVSRGTFAIKRVEDDRYVALSGRSEQDGGERECSFVVSANRNHLSVAAALRRGIQFLEEHPDGLCCFVADLEEMPGPKRWATVHQRLSEFKARKGRVILLDERRRATWYGLVALRNKLLNGDVSLYLASGVRSADVADFALYMKEGFSPNLLDESSADQEDDSQAPPVSREEERAAEERLSRAATELLEGAPMKLMSAEMLLGRLCKQRFEIGYERFLAFLNRRKGCFELHATPQGTIVRVARVS